MQKSQGTEWLMWKERDNSTGVSIMFSVPRRLEKGACSIAQADLKMFMDCRRKPAPGTLPACLIEANVRSRRAQKMLAV